MGGEVVDFIQNKQTVRERTRVSKLVPTSTVMSNRTHKFSPASLLRFFPRFPHKTSSHFSATSFFGTSNPNSSRMRA